MRSNIMSNTVLQSYWVDGHVIIAQCCIESNQLIFRMHLRWIEIDSINILQHANNNIIVHCKI